MMVREYIINDTTMSHASKFACIFVEGEIIRCRDCKHKDDWLDEGGQCGVDPNGFCAWAERDV